MWYKCLSAITDVTKKLNIDSKMGSDVVLKVGTVAQKLRKNSTLKNGIKI